jgi:hypothetical protein
VKAYEHVARRDAIARFDLDPCDQAREAGRQRRAPLELDEGRTARVLVDPREHEKREQGDQRGADQQHAAARRARVDLQHLGVQPSCALVSDRFVAEERGALVGHR